MTTSIRSRLERGEVSELVIVAVVALFVMVGLVVDGGAKMTAASEASSTAQEAARVAAQPLESLPTDGQTARLSPDGISAAQNYLHQAGATGTVRRVDDTTIEVTVTRTEDTVFLSLIGIHSVSATRTARVDLIHGQTEVLP